MWEINISTQALSTLYSLALGVFLGLFYDIMRARRKVFQTSDFLIFAEDILFWLVTTLLTYLFLLSVSNGEVRGYVIIMEFCGFVLFRLTLSKIIFKIFVTLLQIYFKAYCFLKKGFNTVSKFITWCFDKISTFLGKIMGFYLKTVKKVLKSCSVMLYTNHNRNKRTESEISESKV